METYDSTSNALAPNLHAMPAQFKIEDPTDCFIQFQENEFIKMN